MKTYANNNKNDTAVAAAKQTKLMWQMGEQSRLIKRKKLQTARADTHISEPEDPQEKEADDIAKKVVNGENAEVKGKNAVSVNSKSEDSGSSGQSQLQNNFGNKNRSGTIKNTEESDGGANNINNAGNTGAKTQSDGRPGIEMKPDHENRDKASGRWNESQNKTDIQQDGKNYWQTQQDGDQTIVHWRSKDNNQVGGYYSFSTPVTPTVVTEIEITGDNPPLLLEKGGNNPPIPFKKIERPKPEKFNGVEIAKGTTLTNDGVWCVLTTGPGHPGAGTVKDPKNEIPTLMKSVKKTGNIKEVEITIIGQVGKNWTPGMKDQYEYDIAAAKTNLQRTFQSYAGKNINVKFNSYKIENGGNSPSPRTIIEFH